MEGLEAFARCAKAGWFRRKEVYFTNAWEVFGVRCRSDGRVKAATLLVEPNFANSVARISFLGCWWQYCHSLGHLGGRMQVFSRKLLIWSGHTDLIL